MKEPRRYVRLETCVGINYTVLPSGEAQHTVSKDIGVGGFRLVREQPIPVGTQLQLAIALPGREQPVNALAEVVSNEQFEMIGKTDHHRSVEIGTRCVEIAPADQDVLTQYISSQLTPVPA